jgi:hypothetical protein
MKTISIQTDVISRFEDSRMIEGLQTQRSVPAWLPVPPARKSSAATQPNSPATSKKTESIWIPLENDSWGQKLVGGLLVIVTLASIAYGFSTLLDLVQGWSAFNSWVGQIF